jgi:hypothetical protein
MKHSTIRALRAIGREIIAEEARAHRVGVGALMLDRHGRAGAPGDVGLSHIRHAVMYRLASETALAIGQIGILFKAHEVSVHNGIASHAKRNGLPPARVSAGPGRPGIPIGAPNKDIPHDRQARERHESAGAEAAHA